MAKKAKKKSLDLTLPIFQVKISLQHIAPAIWRRVQMDDCTLDELHDIIQIAMGWQDEHLFAFVIDGEQYGDLKRGGEFEYDSRSVRLSDLAEQGHARFQYDYDFGDDWVHIIEVEKTLPVEEGGYYPRCVKGERACPPEDCGGPYEYPYFLEKFQDPKHEEHDDLLEWIGEDFDPEELNLEKANDELRYLRRFLGHSKGKQSQSAFIEGDLVQVNPGIVHDLYPDIPLGGWVGSVTRVIWLTPISYEVDWTESTLQQAHPVYHKRCQRDGIAPKTYFLEAEQFNKASDESPAAIEQPTNLITRPLSMDEAQDRVRVIFGLTSDDALPKADEQTQQQFFDYLKANLSFPFKAEYWPTSAIGPDEGGQVTVFGFSDPPQNHEADVVCQARMGTREVQVPLLGLQLYENDPNAQYVADYTYWLLDATESVDLDEDDDSDEDDDADGEELKFPIGTVALYGPDDKMTTKIVAGVIKEEGADAIIKRWVASDVKTNPKIQKEIGSYFKKYGVTIVSMSDGNIGCPHEEGEDFPVGGDCPFCPWWKGKQGSGAKE